MLEIDIVLQICFDVRRVPHLGLSVGSGLFNESQAGVLRIDAGEGEGTHEELLAQGGCYAELFELQADGYR